MTNTLRFIALATGLILVGAACATDPTAKLCSTGVYCPADLECAAVQAVCLRSPCGNGKIDTGEQCDDGNILDGDRCSSLCRNEGCGNSLIEAAAINLAVLVFLCWLLVDDWGLQGVAIGVSGMYCASFVYCAFRLRSVVRGAVRNGRS